MLIYDSWFSGIFSLFLLQRKLLVCKLGNNLNAAETCMKSWKLSQLDECMARSHLLFQEHGYVQGGVVLFSWGLWVKEWWGCHFSRTLLFSSIRPSISSWWPMMLFCQHDVQVTKKSEGNRDRKAVHCFSGLVDWTWYSFRLQYQSLCKQRKQQSTLVGGTGKGEGPVQPCVEMKRHQKAALLPTPQVLHRDWRTLDLKKTFTESCTMGSNTSLPPP